MILPQPALTDFTAERRTFDGVTKTVYRIGTRGPAVVLMHEVPGVTPNVLRLAKVVADSGYRVALPSLFGHDGKSPDSVYATEIIMQMCVSREFAVFVANGSSPVVDWLRALCVALHQEVGEGKGVGAIGLCITGGFALSLAVDAGGTVKGPVTAPVMSEPSVPFHLPFTQNDAAVHVTPEQQRFLSASDVRAIGLRFTNDWRCKKERFDRYASILGARFDRTNEITSPDPAWNIGAHAHSVLTAELSGDPNHPTNKALRSVLAFFAANL